MIEQLSKKVTNKEGVQIVTNYKDAVNWCGSSYVLCNNIPEIDQGVYDNARFEFKDDVEIYQWFITDASESTVKYLEDRFGLLFTYSDILDCFVLCVDHYGTAWDYVYCADNEMDTVAKRSLNKLKKAVQ